MAVIRSICPASPFLSRLLSVAPRSLTHSPPQLYLLFLSPHPTEGESYSLLWSTWLFQPLIKRPSKERSRPGTGTKEPECPAPPSGRPLEQGAETMEAHVRSLILSVEADYIEGGVPCL